MAYLAFERARYPFDRQLADIGTKSFGIYLLHIPVLELTARSVYHVLPGLLAHPGIFLVLAAVLGVTVPLTLMAVVKSSPVRVLYKYAFG